MHAVASDIASGLNITLPRVDVGALLEVGALLAGVALVSYGAWMAWHPAGFIAGGAQLIYGVIARARGTARGR